MLIRLGALAPSLKMQLQGILPVGELYIIQKPRQGTNGGRCRCSHAKIEAYINALKEELTLAEKKLAIAESGLAMVKALGGVGIPDGASDYQLGAVTGFEQAADIASKTITEIEATK